jgi:hypothetical protein
MLEQKAYLCRNSANFCENCLPICPHENYKQDVISYEVQHCNKMYEQASIIVTWQHQSNHFPTIISCFKSNINNQANSGAKFCIWQTMTTRGLPPSLFHTSDFLNWVFSSSFWFTPSAPPIHATKLVIKSSP